MELKDFKDNKELTLFILMNIFGAPFTVIGLSIWLGLWGFAGGIILFIIFYKWWKSYGKHKGKLSFNPSFTFGNKTWRIN